MANISGIATTLNSPGAFEDLSSVVVEAAGEYQVPLLALLGRTPATSVKHEWIEDRRKPLADALAAAAEDDDTEISVEDGLKFRKRDIIRVGGEVMLVSDIDGDSLTVERGFGRTTAADHDLAAVVEIIGNANREGDAAIEANSTVKARNYNMTQIFQTRIELSGTRAAVAQPGGDEFSYQLLKQFREHLVEIERALISGTRSEGDDGNPRTMAGLIEMITTHTEGIDGTLSQSEFISFLREIYDDGGNPNIILASPLAMQAINFWGKGALIARSDDSLFGLAYAEYLCEFGLLRLVMDRYVPSGSLFALDTDLIRFAPLTGRDTHYFELARTGDALNSLILTEATLELRNEYCHGMLTGITGGA